MNDRPARPRLLAAALAAVATGALVLGLVHFLLLPALVMRLTEQQLAWLQAALTRHTAWVMAGMFGVALVLSVPVLLVALWVGRSGRRAG